MDEVKTLVNEDGAAKVVPSFHLRRPWPEGLHRHRATAAPNRGCLSQPVPEETFVSTLKWFFLVTLGLCVYSVVCLLLFLENLNDGPSAWNIILYPKWFVSTEAKVWGVALLTIFAVVCVRAFIKKLKKTTGSASPGREEVQTISSSIQQV